MLQVRNGCGGGRKSWILSSNSHSVKDRHVNLYRSFTMPRFGQLDLNLKHLLYCQRVGNESSQLIVLLCITFFLKRFPPDKLGCLFSYG